MSTPINIADLMRRVRTGLTAWAAANKGEAEIASDPWNVLEILAQRPGGFRIIILYSGRNKRGEHEEARVADTRFQIVLSMGRALTRKPGQHLADGASGAKPLFQLLDEAENVVEEISMPRGVTEVTPDLIGDEPFTTPEGIALDAYVATFQLGMIRAKALSASSSEPSSASDLTSSEPGTSF